MTRALLTLALLALVSPGCMSAELARVHRDLSRDLPAGRLSGGHALAFGQLTLGLARGIVGTDDAATAAALRHVRGVAVGTYALGEPLGTADLALPQAMERIVDRGWTPVVVARDDSTATFVFARQPGDVLRDLLVVSFEAGELTLVRLSGHLDAAVLEALQGDGDALLGPLHTALRQPGPTVSG